MTHQKAAAGVSRGFDIRQANNVAPLSVNFTMALERPRPGGEAGPLYLLPESCSWVVTTGCPRAQSRFRYRQLVPTQR